jgi:hypothetical protein
MRTLAWLLLPALCAYTVATGCYIHVDDDDGGEVSLPPPQDDDGDVGDFGDDCYDDHDCSGDLICDPDIYICLDADPGPRECSQHADCSQGDYCDSVSGLCAESEYCSEDQPCTFEGFACELALGTCVPQSQPTPCEAIWDQAECEQRSDCEAVYAGVNCSCGPGCECQGGEPGCVCEQFEFYACEEAS